MSNSRPGPARSALLDAKLQAIRELEPALTAALQAAVIEAQGPQDCIAVLIDHLTRLTEGDDEPKAPAAAPAADTHDDEAQLHTAR